jgi:hypothetical protein
LSYQFGRASQILSTKMGVLESYTGLQRSFLGQAPERQKEIVRRIGQFRCVEGVEVAPGHLVGDGPEAVLAALRVLPNAPAKSAKSTG